MISDIVKTIKAQLYDRATSPLSGAFILSWCIWNWRFLLVLVSDLSVIEKLNFIEGVIYPDLLTLSLRGFVCPIVTTLFLIFIYPYPARIVYSYARNQQKKLKEIQQKIEDEEPLTREQAKEIRNTAIQLELKYEVERDQRVTRIKELENVIKSLQENIEPIMPSQEPLEKKTTGVRSRITKGKSIAVGDTLESITNRKEKLLLLNKIAEGEFIKLEDLTKNLDTKAKVKLEHLIDELEDGGYIYKGYDSEFNENGIKLLKNGRAALVNNDLTITK